MSEWKERLKAFDDLAPDEGVYRRAQQGPRRELPDEGPSPAKRITAGLVAFAVFAAAGIFAWRAFQPTADQPASPSTTAVVITLRGTQTEPTATVNFDDSWQAGVFEKYVWCSTPDDCSTVETDLAYPPIQEGVAVLVGAPIRFVGDGRVERAVIRTTEGDQASPNVVADTDGTDVSVPEEPGDYLVWVAADWEQGSGAFYVRVRASLPATPPEVVVPDLVGMPITEAIKLAEGAGLTVETIQVLDDSKLGEPGADEVQSQDPFPGTDVDAGTSISVAVIAMAHPQPYSAPLDEQRVGVYEAMIRELVDPAANGEIIYVNRKLCSYLGGRGDDVGGCSDRIDPAEQAVIAERLVDLGHVEFVDGLGSTGRDETPVTLLGPIIDSSDGLRVEGGYWCGPLCAGGQMYVVELVGTEYEVTGTDRSYGSWIS